ncbi:hypothetical protein K435DRAFT_843512 [Dendrothele bispora CBS 962.96]|uniref:Uncharacterized protein n=1 Tax=Dendrothele bispora (strain CBS 962.96) TaxID=1314807 RepID=A0A4S8L8H9_DENBC|nr:hypothetical protein K435DRAFT_843512 [Dendrothele bispora CBS 962.96]
MNNKSESRPEATIICFGGKRVYVHLKESKKETIKNAIQAFNNIGVPDVPQDAGGANLYVVVDGQKVFFGCEVECKDDKCVCGWMTRKPLSGRSVFLESKVEVERWHRRLPHRIRSMFAVFSEIMSVLMCICRTRKPEGDEANTDKAEYGNKPAGGESAEDKLAANRTDLAGADQTESESTGANQTGSVDRPELANAVQTEPTRAN